ncbi:MAG: malonic semialdehyde reductase [Sphingopyxis sp.]|nr:malonic semialdehyde reductase [Sphingopyxis sp.]
MIGAQAANALFLDARSHNGWQDTPVSDEELQAAYDVAKWGATSMNCQPMRLVFLRSLEAKEKLKPALMPGNVDKAMSAPVVAIVAHDLRFHDRLADLFPHNPAAGAMFASNDGLAAATAFRNGSLQGAYFIMALRAIGLDVGPMSGFDPQQVDAAFFAGTSLRSNFLLGIGHGDSSRLFERLPRLSFEESTRTL